jgi:signal transduction histidine kinase
VRGQYTDEELRAIGVGPRSIMERARELGGHLTLDSSDSGARLDIMLPRNGATPP